MSDRGVALSDPLDRSEANARYLDATDAGPGRRPDFHVPPAPGGRFPEAAYLAGNSLGLQPRGVRAVLDEELGAWADLAVAGHAQGRRPWTPYHAYLREPVARLVGAHPDETVVMNSLTVNLHLFMVSFYRPTRARHAIVVEDHAFPSDSYAVRSQVALHGYDPDDAVLRLRPRAGEDTLRTEDVLALLESHGDRIALVLLGGVNYLTGELLDIPAITAAGRRADAVVGWDLAHAVGNVELQLSAWDVDWAAWCHYKYVNGGPGAVAGAFVHRRHLADRTLPKLSGWWGNDPATRFAMTPVVEPIGTADDWQVSNPPILAMAPLLAALRIFDEVGMAAVRERSVRLTGYLERLLDGLVEDRPLRVITPRDPGARGAQLSVRIGTGSAHAVCDRLRNEHGVVADARGPDVVRLAPAPLYCTHHDVWRAAKALVSAF